MASAEKVKWLYDFRLEGPEANFEIHNSRFLWPMKALNVLANTSLEIDGSFRESNEQKEMKKRARTKSCAPSGSKACREKQRRDRLNDKFMELADLLEPERPPKTDKAAIVADAVWMVTQLRSEAQKLKDSSLNLQEKIKELKAEKHELREEKLRLKAEREKLQQQLMSMNIPKPVGIMPPLAPIPTNVFPSQSPARDANKLMPVMGCPGITMWQFIPPAPVDASQDPVLRPPVA